MQMFLREICLRPSCHDCKFKALERPSDITLGDCWGVHEHMPEMDDDKGTSIILLHSEKGQALLDLICETVIHKEADVDIALSPTADSRKSVPPHKNREKFFVMLNEGSELKKLVKLVREPLFKRVLKKSKQLIKKLLFFR